MMHLICPKQNPKPGERWTNVHVPTPVHMEEIPDEDTDVFESVSDLEEDSLDYSNLNLNGKTIMTKNTLASALTTAGIIHTMPAQGHNYFDPMDIVEDNLGNNAMLLWKTTGSIAWNLDTTCINAARTVLYKRYAESDKSELERGVNPFDLFCQGIVHDLSHQSLYDDESVERTLVQLLALRTQWHDAAQSAASAYDKDYNPKSLEQMLLEEKPMAADVGERINLKVIAKLEAAGDEAKEARLLQAYIDASEIASKNRVENNKKLIPTISLILSVAERYAPADTRFDHLPLSTQKLLTERTVSTINRIKMDVAKTLARNPIEFGHVIEAAYSCTNALNETIKAKYSDAGELENAGRINQVSDHERSQILGARDAKVLAAREAAHAAK